MALRHSSVRAIVGLLPMWSVVGIWSPAAAGNRLPQRFDIEVFPAIHTAQVEQEPVIYRFDGEQVRARWKRTVVVPSVSGAGNLQQVMTTETFRLRNALERLDRYMAEAGDNLLNGKYGLARRQLDTVRAEIEDLHQSVNKGRDATKIAFRGLPSDDAMLRRMWLQFMMGKWKEEYVAAHPCENPGHFAPVHEQVPVPGLGAGPLGRIGDVVGNPGAARHTGGQHQHRIQCDHAPSHAKMSPVVSVE